MADFRQVLRELTAEENRLQQEIDVVRDGIAAIELLMKKQMLVPAIADKQTYENMGTKESILHLLSSQSKPLSAGVIAQMLLEGGIQTKSNDFASSVRSTLHQMSTSGEVQRIEDGWKLRAEDTLAVSLPAPESAAATFLGATPTSGRLHLPPR